MSNSVKRRENLKKLQTRTWYKSNCIQGYTWARFFVFLGGRGAGKSTDIQRYLVKRWVNDGTVFTWLRLTDAEIKQLKKDNCKDAIEPVVKNKFPDVNWDNMRVKGDNLYIDGKLFCRFMALSTYYRNKGNALFNCDNDEWDYIFFDEMNKVEGARNSGDVTHQFKNTIETLLRTKSQKIKVFMIGNLEGLSSILAGCFDWVPLEGKFGIYKVRRRKAVIHYFDDTAEFKKKKAEGTSNLIGSNHSTFTNQLLYDKKLIKKKVRLLSPEIRIKFSNEEQYILWRGQDESYIMTVYQPGITQVTPKKVIAMRPGLDERYDKRQRDKIKSWFDYQLIFYKNLITQELFKCSMSKLGTR